MKSVPFHFLCQPLKFFPPPVNEGGLGGFEDSDTTLCSAVHAAPHEERYGWTESEQWFNSVCLSWGFMCLCGHPCPWMSRSKKGYLLDSCCRDRKTCLQLSRTDSHVYFISGTAGDLYCFAPSCGASHIGFGTLWPRLASTMSAVITREEKQHWPFIQMPKIPCLSFFQKEPLVAMHDKTEVP